MNFDFAGDVVLMSRPNPAADTVYSTTSLARVIGNHIIVEKTERENWLSYRHIVSLTKH